nr:hypothetical protein [Saccharothrix yanglingensis]
MQASTGPRPAGSLSGRNTISPPSAGAKTKSSSIRSSWTPSGESKQKVTA